MGSSRQHLSFVVFPKSAPDALCIRVAHPRLTSLPVTCTTVGWVP